MTNYILATEMVFWVCAIAGTTFFFLRVVMMFFVGFGDLDAELDGDVGGGFDGDLHGDGGLHDGDLHSDMDGSNVAFKLLSLNAITGFFMMFGWVGLAGYRQYGWGASLSTLAAIVAGTVTMVLTGLLFQQAQRLVSKGAAFRIEHCVGRQATVYHQIPAQGRGKVTVTVNDMTRELEAISEDGQAIASFAAVRVVRAVDGYTVSVEKI